MKPARSILCADFVYTPSHKTDIRKTWAKARRKIAAEAAKQQELGKVTAIRKVASK